jgi:HEAT repeat protein
VNLEQAIANLHSGDFHTRWETVKPIESQGAAAIAPLLHLLQTEPTDWELHWFIARLLGNIGHPSTIPTLITLLTHSIHTDVTAMAAIALTHFGELAIAPLIDTLAHTPTRLLSVQALAQIRHPDVVAPLIQVVQDPVAPIRAVAIEALSHFHHDTAIASLLLEALQDQDATVRQAAVMGLGFQAKSAPTANHWVPQIQPLLWDLYPKVGQQAAIALGRIGTEAAIAALCHVLQSPHTPLGLQAEAVRALARIGTISALEGLQAYLTSPNPTSTDSTSTKPASDQSNDQAAVILDFALPDSSPSPAVDSSSLGHLEAIAVLGRVEGHEAQVKATEILLERLQTHDEQKIRERQAIALSLGQLEQLAALEPLIHLLADRQDSVRFHAIAALKQLAPELSKQRLEQFAQDSELEPALQSGIQIALAEW